MRTLLRAAAVVMAVVTLAVAVGIATSAMWFAAPAFVAGGVWWLVQAINAGE